MWTINKLECVDESIALKIIELIEKTTNYITQTLPKSHFSILYTWGGWHSLGENFLSMKGIFYLFNNNELKYIWLIVLTL
jgi:hypothetical protein